MSIAMFVSRRIPPGLGLDGRRYAQFTQLLSASFLLRLLHVLLQKHGMTKVRLHQVRAISPSTGKKSDSCSPVVFR